MDSNERQHDPTDGSLGVSSALLPSSHTDPITAKPNDGDTIGRSEEEVEARVSGQKATVSGQRQALADGAGDTLENTFGYKRYDSLYKQRSTADAEHQQATAADALGRSLAEAGAGVQRRAAAGPQGQASSAGVWDLHSDDDDEDISSVMRYTRSASQASASAVAAAASVAARTAALSERIASGLDELALDDVLRERAEAERAAHASEPPAAAQRLESGGSEQAYAEGPERRSSMGDMQAEGAAVEQSGVDGAPPMRPDAASLLAQHMPGSMTGAHVEPAAGGADADLPMANQPAPTAAAAPERLPSWAGAPLQGRPSATGSANTQGSAELLDDYRIAAAAGLVGPGVASILGLTTAGDDDDDGTEASSQPLGAALLATLGSGGSTGGGAAAGGSDATAAPLAGLASLGAASSQLAARVSEGAAAAAALAGTVTQVTAKATVAANNVAAAVQGHAQGVVATVTDQAQDKVQSVAAAVQENVQGVVNAAQDKMQSLAVAVQDQAQSALAAAVDDRARSVAAAVQDRAQSTAAAVQGRAEGALEAAQAQVQGVAAAVQDKAQAAQGVLAATQSQAQGAAAAAAALQDKAQVAQGQAQGLFAAVGHYVQAPPSSAATPNAAPPAAGVMPQGQAKAGTNSNPLAALTAVATSAAAAAAAAAAFTGGAPASAPFQAQGPAAALSRGMPNLQPAALMPAGPNGLVPQQQQQAQPAPYPGRPTAPGHQQQPGPMSPPFSPGPLPTSVRPSNSPDPMPLGPMIQQQQPGLGGAMPPPGAAAAHMAMMRSGPPPPPGPTGYTPTESPRTPQTGGAPQGPPGMGHGQRPMPLMVPPPHQQQQQHGMRPMGPGGPGPQGFRPQGPDPRAGFPGPRPMGPGPGYPGQHMPPRPMMGHGGQMPPPRPGMRPPGPHGPPPPPSPFPGLLYAEGRDTLGRPVVVINTAYLPAKAKKEEVLQYVLEQLQPVVEREYVLVVLAIGAGVKAGVLSAAWAVGAYKRLAKPYRKNVKHIVLVQPSGWARALLAIAQPFVSKKAAHKIKKVDNLLQIGEATGGEVLLDSLGARFVREVQYGVGAHPLAGLPGVPPGPMGPFSQGPRPPPPHGMRPGPPPPGMAPQQQQGARPPMPGPQQQPWRPPQQPAAVEMQQQQQYVPPRPTF